MADSAPPIDLADGTAIVTGAASGIGLGLARRFAAEGMNLVLADIEDDSRDAAVAELRAGGAAVVGVRTDVRHLDEIEALAEVAWAEFGDVRIVCNNAGVGSGGPSWELTDDDWRWVLDVNLWSVIHGHRVFVPRLLEQGTPAHIVNTASLAGLVAGPFMGPYNASKFGVVAISESLHHELAILGAPVDVSVLCPGWVRTRIIDSSRNRPADVADSWSPPTGQRRSSAGLDAVNDGMDPSDVADMVHDAVLARKFWVLTHPEMSVAAGERIRRALAGENPVTRILDESSDR